MGGSPSSSPSPARSSGAAETAQPSQRVVLGYVKDRGNERGTQPDGGGGGRWLLPLQGFGLSPLNPIAYFPPPATPNPTCFPPIFASGTPLSATSTLPQLAWSLHGFSQRAAATTTAAYSSLVKKAVGLADHLAVQPWEVWRPGGKGSETRPELKRWVPAATAATAGAAVAAERRRTTTVDEGFLLSAWTVRQDCSEYGALGCTPISAVIGTATAAIALAFNPPERGRRSGAVAMMRGGGGAALALLTVGAACGLVSELGTACDGGGGVISTCSRRF